MFIRLPSGLVIKEADIRSAYLGDDDKRTQFVRISDEVIYKGEMPDDDWDAITHWIRNNAKVV